MRSYEESSAWLPRARAATPGGSQTMSKAASKFPEGAYPAFIETGYGSRVIDLDGNRYIDWICSLAAVTLGYGYREVYQAVERALWEGALFSLPHRLEAIVAERLCSLIPCAQMVRFVKTGSEATEAAIRVARAYTGRDVIVTVGAGYDSWHSWFAAVKPEHPGVPRAYETMIRSFQYNDLASLRAAFDSCEFGIQTNRKDDDAEGYLVKGKPAAIILEPTLLIPPYQRLCECGQEECGRVSFLEDVKLLAHEHGALLIFDEIVTGFRWALAGGQEYFGVAPDLATFGKGMTGIGVPLACLVGRRDVMQHAELVSGTFGGDLLGLAACNATLDVYEREPVIEHLWRVGTAFRDGLQALINKHGLPARMVGYGVHPKLEWFPNQIGDYWREVMTRFGNEVKRDFMSLFLQEMAERGVLLHPAGWNVSYTHGDKEVAESLVAADEAFGVCSAALSDGKIRERLRGKPIQSGFSVRS